MTQFWRLTCIRTNELHGICKNKETIEWRQIYTWWCRREHSRRWLRCKKKKKLNCELLNCVHARHCFIHSFSTNSPASFNISNLQNMIFFCFPSSSSSSSSCCRSDTGHIHKVTWHLSGLSCLSEACHTICSLSFRYCHGESRGAATAPWPCSPALWIFICHCLEVRNSHYAVLDLLK